MAFPTRLTLLFCGLAGSLAARPAVAAPNDEVIQVWNNGGKVSIEVYKSFDGRTYQGYSGGGYQLGGASALKFLKGDFNGDGRTDVIQVWNNSGRVSIEGYSWNPATRRFDWTVGGGQLYGGAGALTFLSGDINGDGRTDIIQIWDNAGAVSIEGYTFNASTNRFDYTIGGGAKYGPSANSEFFAGDVDGDGRTDIMHLRQDSSVYPNGKSMVVYRSSGSGFINSTNRTHYPFEEGGWNYRVVGDFNRDGRADLLHVRFVQDPYGPIHDGYTTYLSDGASLHPSTAAFFTANTTYLTYSADFVTADIDGDGDSDLVGLDYYWLHHGKVALNVYPNFLNETGSTSYWQSPNLGGSSYLAILTGNLD
jgi:hypothetical protein